MNLYSVKPSTIRIKGLFVDPIPWQDINPTGDWSKYFGTYEGQKHDDLDSNCCWAFSGNEVLEDWLTFLRETGIFTVADILWFKNNGYIDSDDDFYLSRRFIPILSGVKDNGNDPEDFWSLTGEYGAIPNSVLPFTNNIEYFDKTKVTPAMYALGKQFLTRVNIAYEELGKRWTRRDPKMIQGALFQGELQICIPIPKIVSLWNQVKVDWDGSMGADHAVALYKYDPIADPKYPYFIYDQYEPRLKQLSEDYYIPIITRGIVTPTPQAQAIPIPIQKSTWSQVWSAVMEYFFGENKVEVPV